MSCQVYRTGSKPYRCSTTPPGYAGPRSRPVDAGLDGARDGSRVGMRGRSMRARSVFRDPAWVLVALVCGAAILSMLAMAATRFLLPSERAAIPTGDWPWTSEGVGVTPLTADSPFAAGDVVVAIDGRPIGDWVAEAIAPPWLVGAHPLGTSIHVDAI